MERKRIYGYVITFVSYFIWGILPIYWKQLSFIDAISLLTIRVAITLITLIIIVNSLKTPLFISYLKTPKIRYQLMLTGMFIGFNWGIFVYAVGSGHLVQASLGYYINPLVSIFLGIFFLKERLSISQYISIGLAFIGVMFLTISYGQFPWISLILAFSFGMYGLLKKVFHLDSLNSLLIEAMYVLPFALILTLKGNGISEWGHLFTTSSWIFIILSGIITIIPLILFSEGAKLIPLSSVGFLQYIAPTLMLLIGVLLYGEKFTLEHAITFCFIWLGLSIYTLSIFRKGKKVA